jgi:hypothetical protein
MEAQESKLSSSEVLFPFSSFESYELNNEFSLSQLESHFKSKNTNFEEKKTKTALFVLF